jgi:hypothetical protein
MTRLFNLPAFLSLSLLLLSPILVSAGERGGYGPVYPVVQQISNDVRLVELTPEVAVEQIRGASAVARLQKIMARHPEVFAKSRKRWLERGYTPTQEVFIERTVRRGAGNGDITLTQTSGESNAEGEILFWSYDGPGYTWQGTIYVEVYADNSASMWDGQIDTSSDEHPWIFQEMTWSGGGSGPEGPENRVKRFGPPPLPGHLARTGGIQLAVNRQPDFRSHNGPGILPVRSFYDWAVCWRAGVVSGCTTAAVGCMRVKAGWPACFGLWCVGAEIGSAIGCAMMP